MSALLKIHGIGKTTLELLEAAGFRDVESLARAGAADLQRELDRANKILNISKRPPTLKLIEQWIGHAREATGTVDTPAGPSQMPVNYEQSPQVASMLANAPLAIPLPARILMENQLGVSDIPPAILLNRYSGDLDVRVDQRVPQNKQPRLPASVAADVKVSDYHAQRLDIDISRVRSTDEFAGLAPVRQARTPTPESDRIDLLRAPRESTNKGRNPNSRWYIRGVLHTHPGLIMFGAFITLCLLVMIPASVISAALLLLSGEVPRVFGWVPGWLLWIPISLPVFGIVYLIWGLRGSCRICGQQLFVRRSHLKNSKAHHVRFLGYVIPLCFQILVFRWFRCSHCGTPVRLKE